ncbi:MetS family NSS transporter small subunit [Siminovitchia terrae]|nr:MetS family NSS transporter small subunit [Siminovitchia terrae]
MSMDAIVVMIFSIVLLWGGLGYFIFRFVKNRKFKKGYSENVTWFKKSDL